MTSSAAVTFCGERLPAASTTVSTVWLSAGLVSAALAGSLAALRAATAGDRLTPGAGTLTLGLLAVLTALALGVATVCTGTDAGFYLARWAATWTLLLGFLADLAA